MQSKNMTPGVESGVASKEKFNVQTPLRTENNEMAQRPVANKETLSSDRGSFKTK